MITLVLLRHGESTGNVENRFAGWTDVDLTEQGTREAHRAGRTLKESGYLFDLAYTSVLKRAIRTLWIVQDEMDLMWVPVSNSWRLNERHYGALQGIDKKEIADRFGMAQFQIWQNSYDIPPPAIAQTDARFPVRELRYENLKPEETPLSESFKNMMERLLPYWQEVIVPNLHAGKKVLIVSHRNPIRALIKHLDHLPDEAITELDIPTAVPLIYELDCQLRAVNRFFLGNQAAAIRELKE